MSRVNRYGPGASDDGHNRNTAARAEEGRMSSLVEGNSQFAVGALRQAEKSAGEPLLLAEQHLDGSGDGLRRSSGRNGQADGRGSALPAASGQASRRPCNRCTPRLPQKRRNQATV